MVTLGIGKNAEEHSRKAAYDKAYSTILSYQKYILPKFSREEYHGYDKIYDWKCRICGTEFKQVLRTTSHILEKGYKSCPRCLKCFPYKRN